MVAAARLRGTASHLVTVDRDFCVAGVALGDIDRHFGWQAWHLWHWAGSGDLLESCLPPLVAAALCVACVAGVARAARLVTVNRHFCVAGVALGDIDRHFGWQVWHLRHWAGSGDLLGSCLPPWSPRHFAWQLMVLGDSRP